MIRTYSNLLTRGQFPRYLEQRITLLSTGSSTGAGTPKAAAPAEPKISHDRFPQINEADLEEQFISGSGPGGQSVNKAVNCCQLKHKPTGIVVKVHQQRSLEANRKIARELLAQKLDNLYNGEMSVANQKKRLALSRISLRDAERERRRQMKEEFKKMRSLEEPHGQEAS